MKAVFKYSYTLFLLLILFGSRAQTVQQFTVLPKLSIRALEVISDNTIWFAGNRGVWGYTEDAGKTWRIDSIEVDGAYPQFRSIAAINDSTIFLLSIASPGYLYKTTNKGKTWKLVYKDPDPKTFFDSMIFTDTQHGFAIGDPINGHVNLIATTDGGNQWKPMQTDKIPPLMEGEACFATSNSNLDAYKNRLWFVSGGKRARLFYSSNSGASFLTYDTPLPQGETMTGIFSLDFFDEKLGAIAGGNYDKTDSTIVSLAITKDGGKTWIKPKNKKAFFGSCVRFKNANEIYLTGHNGTFTYNLRTKEFMELKEKEEILKYYTLRFSPSKKVVWMAGSGGKIALVKDLK